jgi:uncharacterized membrane protein YoaK (UPF0700 family)
VTPDARPDHLRLAVVLTALLAAAAGCVDVVALVYAGVFVANQTGNLVVVAAASIGDHERVVLALTALLSFAVFVVVGTYARRAVVRSRGRHPARLVVLGGEAVLLAVAGVLVLQRPTAEGSGLQLVVALLAASQGLQAMLVTRVLGGGIRTVAVTGSLTDALVSSVDAVAERRPDPVRRRALLLAGATPAGYALGAAVAALIARTGLHLSVLAALLLAAASAVVLRAADRRGLDLA